jgi:hypothetical protein
MMNQSLGIAPLQAFLSKHHAVIFISFIAILLGFAVYSLTGIMQKAEAPAEHVSGSTISNFDQSTIEKIKKLHDSSDPSNDLTFPSPRFNPFVE